SPSPETAKRISYLPGRNPQLMERRKKDAEARRASGAQPGPGGSGGSGGGGGGGGDDGGGEGGGPTQWPPVDPDTLFGGLGPITDPEVNFGDTNDLLWGRWLDMNARIHLRVIRVLERLEQRLAGMEFQLTALADTAILNAQMNLRRHTVRLFEEDPDFYDSVSQSYKNVTGNRLPPFGESVDGESDADFLSDGDAYPEEAEDGDDDEGEEEVDVENEEEGADEGEDDEMDAS
ncbi:hypothetical protein HWV62_6150, partial [Athelia sp. TMB]